MNRTLCWLCAVLTSLLILTAWIPDPARADGASAGAASGQSFDRLDGHGASGAKVDVIEWQGNLEIHAAPKGILKGLALKLDNRNKGQPVMVIGYRFRGDPGTQLIRRAILGIPLSDGFKTYQDPTEPDFDKIIISMNGLSSPLVAYRLDPAPTRLYPVGYAAAARKAGIQQAGTVASDGSSASDGQRQPASPGQGPTAGQSQGSGQSQSRHERRLHKSGTIQPFMMQ